jgi:chaperonin GroES
MQINPRDDRIVVKLDDYLEHASDVILVTRRDGIVESQAQFGKCGTVLAVGPGKRDKRGNRRPLVVAPGDRVLIGEFAYLSVQCDDGEQYCVCQEADICGVIDAA